MVPVCCISRSQSLKKDFQDETLNIFLSETTRPRGLIFVMKHHLVILYQVCSNYAPVDRNGPARGGGGGGGGHMFYIGLYSEKHEKIFLSEIIWPRFLIFGM